MADPAGRGRTMLGKTSHRSLSRRVVAYYLTFGLAAAAWLAVGMGVAAKSVLQLGTEPDTDAWAMVISAAQYAPAVLLLPMLLVAIGAVVLRRAVGPVAEIENQLQHAATAPSLSQNHLRPVPGPTSVEAGWNRLVESLGNGDQQGSLDERLDRVLETYRQQKSEHILNALADGIAVTDENRCVTFANKALISLLGLGTSSEPLEGKKMEDRLVLEAAGKKVEQLLDPKLRKRTVVVETGRPDGNSEGVLRVARSPLHYTDDGPAGGFVWSVRDVTQQKLADQMRDQFVNVATHELRTPMANIKAYAETLALGEVVDVEQQKTFCNIINDEVTRLARFVDDLLYLSSMEVGATALKQQVTDMERLLEEVADKTRPQMEQKGLAFVADLPGKLPELVVDKDKLTVALVNLLGNAAKYTPDGGRVRLHVDIVEDALQINVEDTGIGIPADEISKVLDKFFRSSDPRVHDQTGTGLGLSLTNEIVRLHGGKLSVHSELDKGSKFTMTLPIATE